VASGDAASRDTVSIEPEGRFASTDTVNECKWSVSSLGWAADMSDELFAIFEECRSRAADII
jgi:hypothetical protein